MGRKQPSERLSKPVFRAPPFIDVRSTANQIAGITTLASGSATVVCSTTMVKSDSLILFGRVGNANVASGTSLRNLEVKTITDSAAFTLGTDDGAAIPRDTLIHWMLLDTSTAG